MCGAGDRPELALRLQGNSPWHIGSARMLPGFLDARVPKARDDFSLKNVCLLIEEVYLGLQLSITIEASRD